MKRALNASLINQGARCTSDAAPVVDCDDCPSDPAKDDPGVCGCGVADTDSDGDGTPDCLQTGDDSVGPAAPTVIAQRKRVLFVVPDQGRNAIVRLVVAYPRGYRYSRKTYQVEVSPGAFTIGPFPSGARA